MEIEVEIKSARDIILYGVWRELEHLNKGLSAINVSHQELQITHHNTRMSILRLEQMLKELRDGD